MFRRKIKSVHRIKVEIQAELRNLLHANKARNRSQKARLFSFAARKKSLVGKVNRGKRLKFAKDMLKKPIGFGEAVT